MKMPFSPTPLKTHPLYLLLQGEAFAGLGAQEKALLYSRINEDNAKLSRIFKAVSEDQLIFYAVLSSLFFRLHTTTIKSQTRMFIVLQSTQKGFVCRYL